MSDRTAMSICYYGVRFLAGLGVFYVVVLGAASILGVI